MKNILIILIAFFSCALFAQERTVDLNGGKIFDLSVNKVLAYNGTSSDRLLPTTRDTIDYFVLVSNQSSGPLHFYINIILDTIAGIDTTVAITIQGKKTASESYSDIIASALTSVVSAEATINKTSLGVITEFTETVASATDLIAAVTTTNSDTVTVAARSITRAVNTSLYYRYLKCRLILSGNDSVGTGVKVKRVEIVFFN